MPPGKADIQELRPSEEEVRRLCRLKGYKDALEAADRLLDAAKTASKAELRRACRSAAWVSIRHGRGAASRRLLLRFYERALRLLVDRFGPGFLFEITWLPTIVSLYMAMGRRRLALRFLQDRVALASRLYGPRHDKTRNACADFNDHCSTFGELHALENMVKRTIRAFGKKHPSSLDYRHFLVEVYGGQGRAAKRARLFRDAAVCEHLAPVKNLLLKLGARIKKVGQPMGKKRWLWFDRLPGKKLIRKALTLAECVRDHYGYDPHYWLEDGFVCRAHGDGIMGPGG